MNISKIANTDARSGNMLKTSPVDQLRHVVGDFCASVVDLGIPSENENNPMTAKEIDLWTESLKQLELAAEALSFHFRAERKVLDNLRSRLDTIMADNLRLAQEKVILLRRLDIEEWDFQELSANLRAFQDFERSQEKFVTDKASIKGRLSSLNRFSQVSGRRTMELGEIVVQVQRLIERGEEILRENIIVGDRDRKEIENRVTHGQA